MKNLLKLFVLLILLSVTNLMLNAQNYLSIKGNKLLDSQGNEVRLTGVNWFGFETNNLHVHGIWSRDTKSMLKQIKDQGFNCIRIPWCNKIMDPSASFSINAYGKDPYTGVSPMNKYESTLSHPLELLDVIVQWCQKNNMKIILDNHSRQPDGYINELLWYTNKTPESQWIADWVALTKRYKDYDAVIGMDLNNEPHGSNKGGATWGNSNPKTDWNKAAERCGNAILKVNPDVLILVEGIERYKDDYYWWGGNLKGVADYPVQLSHPDKLLYSPHEYGPTVHNQPWFSDPNFPKNMPGIWEEHFNFIHTKGISHLLVGEFGIRDQSGKDEIWFDTFMAYMGKKGYSWTFWCWNPNSGDTGGLLDDQWVNIIEWKMAKLRPYLAPEIPNGSAQPPANRAPVASIKANPVSGTMPLTVSFDGSQSYDPDNDPISYSWNFGDGSTGTAKVLTHIYRSAGTYKAVLTVTDDKGASNVASVNISVKSSDTPDNKPPIAAIKATPTTGTDPLTVSFDASGSIDPDGDVLTYTWSFGDGSSASGVKATHTYTEGTYTASVSVSDGKLTNVASVTIQVKPSDNGGEFCKSPVSISVPYAKDGVGEYCWVTSNDIAFVNSWNMAMVKINGVDYTNKWSNNMPPKQNGNYYIYYKGSYPWSHFEASGTKNTSGKSSFENKVIVFPNPLRESAIINIENPESVTSIEIVDHSGRIIERYMKHEINSAFEIGTDLSAGSYYLRLNTNMGIRTIILNKL